MTKVQKSPRQSDLVESPLEIVKLLSKHYPDAHCELTHESPFQLLIATILSAQCTDERVNQVTKVLFSKFPAAKDLAKAPIEEVEKIIHATGFFRNKAKNIKACAQTLVHDFKGEVPPNLDELTKLPGVGRKTANVVLGNSFGIVSGIVVDTHVARLSQRFGWLKNSEVANPEKIEQRLMTFIPKNTWIILSHYLIFHGRRHCKARKPNCEGCFLIDHCPRKGV